MKESDFISKNAKRWQEIEGRLNSHRKNTTGLSKDFSKIVDDLSYSQSFYKRRFVKVYLNSLSVSLYKTVFSKSKKRKGDFLNFWNKELPLLIYYCRKEMGLSLLIFLIAVIAGVVSTQMEPGFTESILGSNYVNMTEENIEKGDPMNVYKSMNSIEMFFMIFYNNIQVCFFSFVLGILAGIGTSSILISNGVMLGTFQYYFYTKGMFWLSFLTIWQHGSIEVPAIIFSGGAGLVIAKGLLFPNTLSRSLSLRVAFKKGIRLMLGISPAVLLAAIIESFYTRYDNLPISLRIVTVILGFGIVSLVYVYLPYKRAKEFGMEEIEKENEDYQWAYSEVSLPNSLIQKVGSLIFYSIQFIQSKFSKYLLYSSIAAIIFSFLGLYFSRNLLDSFQFYSIGGIHPLASSVELLQKSVERFSDFSTLFNYVEYPLLAFIFLPLIGFFINLVISNLKADFPFKSGEKKPSYLSTYFLLVPVFFLGLYSEMFFVWSLILFPMITLSVWFSSRYGIVKGILKTFKLIIHRPIYFFLTLLLSSLFCLVFFLLLESPILFLILGMVNNFIGLEGEIAHFVSAFMVLASFVFLYLLTLVFSTYSVIQGGESMLEIVEANQLNEKIEEFSI